MKCNGSCSLVKFKINYIVTKNFSCAVCNLPVEQLYGLRGKKDNKEIDESYYISWKSQSSKGNIVRFQGMANSQLLWVVGDMESLLSNDFNETLTVASSPFGLHSWELESSEGSQDFIFTQVQLTLQKSIF